MGLGDEDDLFTASNISGDNDAPVNENNDSEIIEEENIKVCVRLRPTSKFEASRRGRNCVEIDEEQTRITVDSPLEGEYDFSFDRVFDEESPQAEVHEFAGRPLASRLLSGCNCALIAYGQTGSGKTHTMIGEGSVVSGSSGATSGGNANGTGRGSANGIDSKPLLAEDLPHTDMLDVSAKSEKLRELLQPPDVTSWEEKQEMKEESVDESKEGVISELTGVVPRIIKDLYREMGESPATTEFVVRCSYVKIYLEKIIDLLSPVNRRITIVDKKRKSYDSSLTREDDDSNSVAGGVVHIEGASEACCFDENDVLALFARGNACRTVTATKMNSDSSRSHAVFLIKLEQRDCVTGITKTSQLTLVDMAGSEMAAKGKKQKARAGPGGSALQQEAKMVNRSFTALNYVVKSLTDSRNANPNAPSEVPYRRSKFTRLLRHAFGGNCSTTLLLTASPSSYNISETIATLRFGRRCREIKNSPKISSFLAPADYRKQLDASEKKQKELMSFVKALAQECRSLKSDGMKGRLPKGSHSGPLWGSIDTILEENDEEEADETITEAATLQASIVNRRSFVVQGHGKNILVQGVGREATGESKDSDMDDLEKADLVAEVAESHEEIAQLKKQIKSLTDARDKAENFLGEMQSQIAVLRTRNENLNAEKKKNDEDLIHARNEIQVLSQRKTELEHNLRTSQFRENEATVFLRQFRRFYRRLLRNKAAQGTGETGEITTKVPGVPDLNGLIDVDTLLLESGLIEEDELHDDTSVGTYKPSSNALLKSTSAAKKAAKEASALEKAGEGWDDGTGSLMSSSSVGGAPLQTLKYSEKEGLDAISEMGDGGVSEMGDNTVMKAAGGIAKETIEEESSTFSSQQGSIRNEGSTSDNAMRLNAADDITSIGMRKWDMDSPLEGATTNEDAGAVTNSDVKSESDIDAGTLTESSVVSGTESFVSSVAPTSIISRSSNGASTIAPSNLALRQKALKTPAGRLSNMREKDLERDLLQMTERCIELQIALNEEKANVDILTNKSNNSLSKKRLAQEAIQLRQQLDRKTHDLQAIIWKMNELHLINKTYNEKMANREQHVTYLEENLVSLQNTNRRIITQQQESEKKLREELETLKVMADAMTVPLWQFGECKITEKNLSNRIVLPVRGKKYPDESEPASAIIGNDEGSLDSAHSDESSQNESLDPSKAVAGAVGARALGTALQPREEPKIPKMDAITQTDEEKENKPVMVDQWTVTKKIATLSRGTEAKPVMVDEETMVEVDALEDKIFFVEIGTMTDESHDLESAVNREGKGSLVERGTMTDEFHDLASAASKEITSHEQGTMTEAVEIIAEKAPCEDEGTMTEAVLTLDRGTMTEATSIFERGTMTERYSTLEIGTMTVDPDTAEKGTITDIQENETSTAAAFTATAAIATAIPDGSDRGRPLNQDSKNVNEDIVQRGAERSAYPRSNKADNAPEDVGETARKMDDMSSTGGSTNPPTREVAFQKEPPLPEGNEDIRSSGRDSRSSDVHDSISEGQLPDAMFPGGKPANYQPRRFVKKLGPKIKSGVLKESKKKSNAASSTTSRSTSNRRSNSSSRSATRSRTSRTRSTRMRS